jgi:TolB protein
MKRAVALIAAFAAAAPAAVDTARPPQLLTFSIANQELASHARGGLCVSRANGRNALLLLHSPSERDVDFGAQWTPDGRYVVFSRWFGSDRLTDLVLADSRGRVIRNLNRRDGHGLFETDAAWSPNGRRLAFAKAWRGTGIALINRDGTNLRELVPEAAGEPAWSPDGRTVAFTSARGGLATADNPSIHTIATDGTNGQAILPGARNPAWSPDGRKLVFANGIASPGIAVANPDGSERRNLTFAKVAESMPAWSPDGRYIAFERGERQKHIVVIEAKTGRQLWTIRRRHGVFSPSWRPPVALPRAKRKACR